ncbi:N-acetylmuramoyl-L-alanine amidase [Kerstersia similis]
MTLLPGPRMPAFAPMTRRRHRTSGAALLLGMLALAGCASVPPKPYMLDDSHRSVSHSSRARFIVLHYTAADRARSLHLLSQGAVSSHYLVSDETPGKVYALVDENRAAWHAGASSWYGYTWLNGSSIGIEIVNPGWVDDGRGGRAWPYPYSEEQIQAIIALVKDIAQRHGVAPQNIVAHSDIAPTRKQDPGPLFPWKRLAEAGLGRWYDEALANDFRHTFEEKGLPDAAWFQENLARVGYGIERTGKFDETTLKTIAAFQMHYRPTRSDGLPDAETAAILQALR